MWRTRTLNIHEIKEVIWYKEAIKSAHVLDSSLISWIISFQSRESKKLIATSRKHFGERVILYEQKYAPQKNQPKK